MTLSSLLVACSGGGGSAGNRADRVEEKAQPVQSNSEPSSAPIKNPTNTATNDSLHDKLSMSSHDTSKENSQQSSFKAPLEQEKTNLHKKISLGQVIMFQKWEMRVIM